MKKQPLPKTTPLRAAALALAAAFALTACQTTPPVNEDINGARDVIDRAASNPYATRAAAVELDRAQQALRRAQAAWADNRDRDLAAPIAAIEQYQSGMAGAGSVSVGSAAGNFSKAKRGTFTTT